MTIGEFARVTQLSVRTLRRYHEAGLLAPEHVDPHTGYRYYATAQVGTAQAIRRFRALGMPVAEVAQLVATGDDDARHALLAAHLRRLEVQLETTREAVAALHRLLDPTRERVHVTRRAAPARTVAAVVAEVDGPQAETWYGEAMAELDDALAAHGAVPDGPPGGLYDDALFTGGRGCAVVYVPTAAPPTRGRVRPFELPARALAVAVHPGPHHDVDVTYGALGTWLVGQGLAVDGPVQETYLVGPRDTDDVAVWRTELARPVLTTG
ncbi:MerR family transcriptional regulator [Actinomycetospora cinnamomea]|uniref:DNA-binding transcriptional MerR regulator n=1 Tax=Actinomycetospora cinnamomea TaxID=663609 RepID=A0A2U1F8E2_9PSEU|nr:MerR family transcriptional regulator [Actinomycetospora cinnamomea]PVZ08452.1 DNA-binding transcriptional MerR regulator [Actinomycetospora cinnamomea]